jgi:fumarate hydratase class II
MPEMRKDKDALGEVWVPVGRYYGAQTQRAFENFKVGSIRFPQQFIEAHALVKKAAAGVNHRAGKLEEAIADAITQAADEVIAGKWNDHFPLVIFQSGSGTQTNMNVNEVIANRAIEILGGVIGSKNPVHPNDHVNMSQSTNDTVPTSIHIASVLSIRKRLFPALKELIDTFKVKEQAFASIIKIGRTHLQDATPLTLGQEFSGYRAQLELCNEVVQNSLFSLCELPIGGTAVGTGINADVGFDQQMVAEINRLTGETFVVAKNKFAHMAAHDAVVAASGALKTLAVALMKIANDLRWLGSGPRSGLGEISLPSNEPGSSIMPGKVNPTQCEMVTQVVCQVVGNDAAIALAGSQGNFELNVFKPILAHALIQSITLLTDACSSFAKNCVAGVEANTKRIAEHLKNSLMLVTGLNRHIGYDKAAEIALKAWREDKTLKETAVALGYVSESDFDKWVNPKDMIKPS